MATPVTPAPPIRNGAWEPLPAIIYGFATHPLIPASVPRSQTKQLFLSIEGDEESYELPLNPFQVPIEVGDEVYAFERYVSPDPKLSAWYRG